MKHNGYFLNVVLPIMLVSGTAYATPLPLGQMTQPTQVTCPANAAQGAVCTHYLVTGCKDGNGNALADIGVTIALTGGGRGASSKGTIVMHAGGAATGFLNTAGFADYYVSQGFTVAQLAWDKGPASQGWNTDGSGLLYHACRTSTVFAAVYNNPTAHNQNTAFCGQGISGGATVLGMAIEHFQDANHPALTQDNMFDYVLLASGSPVGRADVGCAPANASVIQGETWTPNAPIVNCGITSYANANNPPNSPPPYYEFTGPLGVALNAWNGTTTCGSANPSQSDIDRWAANSNVSTGPLGHQGVFTHPATNVSFYFCGVTNNNPSLGLARFQIDVTQPKNSPVPVNCFTQCQVEGVWNDPNAVTQTKSDMLKFCVLNKHSNK